MGFQLIAYSVAIAATALTFVTALTDQVMIQGALTSQYKIPANLTNIVACYIDGNLTTSARLEAPSLIATYGSYHNVSAIDATDAKVVSASQVPFNDWFEARQNIQLAAGDTLQVNCRQSASTSKVVTALVWLANTSAPGDANPIPPGVFETLRLTSSTTNTANAWTLTTAPALDQAIKPGTYAVGGLRYEGTSAQAARLVGITKDGTRPGGLGYQDAKTPDAGPKGGRFRWFNAGVWGAFSADNIPQIECLSSAGDTAQTFYMDVVKVG